MSYNVTLRGKNPSIASWTSAGVESVTFRAVEVKPSVVFDSESVEGSDGSFASARNPRLKVTIVPTPFQVVPTTSTQDNNVLFELHRVLSKQQVRLASVSGFERIGATVGGLVANNWMDLPLDCAVDETNETESDYANGTNTMSFTLFQAERYSF